MTHFKSPKKVNQKQILRAVASSSAIETGLSTRDIERQLKSKKSKFQHLALA